MHFSNFHFYPYKNNLYSKPVKGLRGCEVGYRFAFNGKERDNETYGEGNAYDFGARIYDPRLGRWLSLDPLQAKYPGFSPYNFSLDNPIFYLDLDGRDVGAGIIIKNNSSQPIVIRGDGEQIKTFVDGTQRRINGDNKNFDPKELAKNNVEPGDDAIRGGFTLNPGDSYRPTKISTKDADGNTITIYGGLITRANGTYELTDVHDPDFVDLEKGQKLDISKWSGSETVSPETHKEKDGGYPGSGITKGEVKISSSGDKTDLPSAEIEIVDSKEKGKLELKEKSGSISYDTDKK